MTGRKDHSAIYLLRSLCTPHAQTTTHEHGIDMKMQREMRKSNSNVEASLTKTEKPNGGYVLACFPSYDNARRSLTS